MATQFWYTGDHDFARKFRPRALKELRVLKKAMGFQNLFQGQRRVVVKRRPQVVISCVVAGITEKIVIYAQPLYAAEKLFKELKECFCSPCFSMGIIRSVPTYTEEELVDGKKFKHTVDVCTGKGYLETTATADGWAEYYLGQYVLVGVDSNSNTWPSSNLPNCCSRNACLFETVDTITDYLYIYPLHVLGKMVEYYDVK